VSLNLTAVENNPIGQTERHLTLLNVSRHILHLVLHISHTIVDVITSNRVYLGEDLSVGKMHRLYDKMSEEKNWGAFSCAGCLRATCTGAHMALSQRQADALNAAPANMADE